MTSQSIKHQLYYDVTSTRLNEIWENVQVLLLSTHDFDQIFTLQLFLGFHFPIFRTPPLSHKLSRCSTQNLKIKFTVI